MDNIRDIIRSLVNDTDIKYCVVAKVTAVDKTANTVDVEPLDNSAELLDVRLQAGSGAGVVLYPVVGSLVTVSFLGKNEAYVSQFSKIELLDIQTQNESLKKILADLFTAIKSITVTTPAGPSGTPINFAQFDQLSQRLNNLLK